MSERPAEIRIEEAALIVTAIAAIDRSGLIGAGGQLPWHLPRDLKRFRKQTMGKPVVLGRKTWDALGKPLDGRLNIVVTRQPQFEPAGARAVGSVEAALDLAASHRAATDEGGPEPEVMIIGGGAIYAATLARWDRLLLTVVDAEFVGDTFFPLDPVTRLPWRLVAEEFAPADSRNPHPQWFLTLDRRRDEADSPADFDLASWLLARRG